MWENILATGTVMFAIMLGLLYIFENYDVTSLTNLFAFNASSPSVATRLMPYELSLFFTIFVFLQFWNMFNARAFGLNITALNLKNCSEFNFIAIVIFIGQLLIITFGGAFFNVLPLALTDWLIIISATSLTLWIGEGIRAVKR